VLTTLWCRIVIAWQLLRLVPRLDLNFFLSYQIIERTKNYEIYDRPDPIDEEWRVFSRVELPFTASDWLAAEEWPALLRGPVSRIVRSLARVGSEHETRDIHRKETNTPSGPRFIHRVTDDGFCRIVRRPR